MEDRTIVTNTTLNLHWEITVPLSNCDEEVFSITPYSFEVENELSQFESETMVSTSPHYHGNSLKKAIRIDKHFLLIIVISYILLL